MENQAFVGAEEVRGVPLSPSSIDASSTAKVNHHGSADHGLRPGWRSRMDRPRGDPYGLTAAWTNVGGRPVRSLSAGALSDNYEVVVQAGLGAPGYLVPLARHLSQWTRVTLLDLPGWHRGRAYGCPPTLAGVTAAAAGWLEVGDRRRVVLAGHSTGGQAALHTALLASDRVAGVILMNPSFDPSARSPRRALAATLRTLPREPTGAAEVAGPSYLRSGGVQLLRFVRSAMADHCEDHIQRLPMAALVLTATRDPFCSPKWAQHLATLAGASYRVVEGAHMAQFGQPGVTAELIHDAIRRWQASDTPQRPR
jgi:pimeloyl-ACP methyl ester carboxylesterase